MSAYYEWARAEPRALARYVAAGLPAQLRLPDTVNRLDLLQDEGPIGLVRMELNDGLGQRTVIGFSQWRRNPAFAAGTFRFTPPKGVDVVGSVSPGAEVSPLK